jgi:large subunit ribosomal protein L7Ae
MPKAGRKKITTKRAAPYEKKKDEKPADPLLEKRPRNFAIGCDVPPKRDLTRFVRWPRYVKIQRQKAILMARLKVPPSINQFTRTLDKNTATQLFKLLHKYRPEDAAAKKGRLLAAAQAKVDGKEAPASKKPNVVKFGINHVTALIEQKQAKLVVIAADVSPIEIVVWLPALCRKVGVPYCIVQNKARLGLVCRKKTATAVAITSVNKEDMSEFSQLVQGIKENYNDRYDEFRRTWGGGKYGIKSTHTQQKRAKAIAKEAGISAKRM